MIASAKAPISAMPPMVAPAMIPAFLEPSPPPDLEMGVGETAPPPDEGDVVLPLETGVAGVAVDSSEDGIASDGSTGVGVGVGVDLDVRIGEKDENPVQVSNIFGLRIEEQT